MTIQYFKWICMCKYWPTLFLTEQHRKTQTNYIYHPWTNMTILYKLVVFKNIVHVSWKGALCCVYLKPLSLKIQHFFFYSVKLILENEFPARLSGSTNL